MTNKKNSDSPQKQQEEDDSDNLKPIPDGGYGWLVLAGAFIISFLIDVIMYTFGVILKQIGKDTDSSDKITNLLSCLNTGLLFFSGPLVSGLVNQFGVRIVVVGGGAITAFMYICTALTSSIYVMMITYGVVGGISTGCCYLASLLIIPDYFDKRRGIATGITMAGSGVGSFALPPVISGLIEAYDWKFCMSVCACVLFECCVFGALLKPLNPKRSDNQKAIGNNPNSKVELKRLSTNIDSNNNNCTQDDTTYDEFGDETQKSKAMIQTYAGGSLLSINKQSKAQTNSQSGCAKFRRISLEILKEMSNFKLLKTNKVFTLIVFSNFFCFLGYFAPFIYIMQVPLEYNTTLKEATSLLSIIGIVNIPFRILFGMIADRKILSAINLNTFCVSVLTLALFLFPWLKTDYYYLIGFAVLFAIGAAGMNCLTTMYLLEIVEMKDFANANGIVNLFRGFGCLFGPFLSGVIADATDYKSSAFIYSSFCFLIGLSLTTLCSFSKLLLNYLKRNSTKHQTASSINEEK